MLAILISSNFEVYIASNGKKRPCLICAFRLKVAGSVESLISRMLLKRKLMPRRGQSAQDRLMILVFFA